MKDPELELVERADTWLKSGETGVSSKTILSILLPRPMASMTSFDWSSPLDSEDFDRCIKLLDIFPGWEARLQEVADACPQKWKSIVQEWVSCKALYMAGRTRDLDRLLRSLRSCDLADALRKPGAKQDWCEEHDVALNRFDVCPDCRAGGS